MFVIARQRTLVELVEESGVCLPLTEVPCQLAGAGGQYIQEISMTDSDV